MCSLHGLPARSGLAELVKGPRPINESVGHKVELAIKRCHARWVGSPLARVGASVSESLRSMLRSAPEEDIGKLGLLDP